MSELPVIRPLEKKDWKIASAMRLEALKECPGVFGSRIEVEQKYTSAEWQDWLRPNGKCIFGLFDKDQMIGITGVIRDREHHDVGILVASYIKQPYRGQGFSDALYRARIDWAVKYMPWKKLRVGHRDGNEPSRRANQRHGFAFTHRLPKTWPDGTTCDELCYELDLEKLRQKA